MKTSLSALLVLLGCTSVHPVLAAAPAPDLLEPPRALEEAFLHPSRESRLRVWWHWISGNISREGITADLEAMQRAGIGGFNLFVIYQAVPPGPVRFGSPEYFDLLRHTAEEADRLGLVMEMTHAPGYSGTGGPWVTPELASQKFVWTTEKADPRAPKLPPQPETVAEHYRDIALLAFPAPETAPGPVQRNVLAAAPQPYPEPTAAAVVAANEVVDLTSRVRPDGTIDWTPPAGDWVLLRLGHTPTGKRNHPVPPEAGGLECNKLDRAAVEHAFVHGFQPVLDRLGPLAGRVLAGTLIDSYESGANDWAPGVAAEFERRAGYSMLPWLPVFAGYAVGGPDEARRFLWDYHKVIAELYSENYYAWIDELARQRGLILHSEGNHSAGSTLTCNGVVSVPMLEFWRSGPGHSALAGEAISGAILYGRPRVAAESFSQFPDQGWRVVPENMKAGADQAFANGINRLYIHRFAHQPWFHVRPGMTMGYWGMWFDRTLTWWDQGIGFNTYVGRAQGVLQLGETLIDAFVWMGEGLSNDGYRIRDDDGVAALRRLTTHRLALLNGDALRGPLSIGPGGLHLPSGGRIQIVVIPPGTDLTVDSLSRLHSAVQQGLTLIGEPPSGPAGRHVRDNTPARFQEIVRALWGDPAKEPSARTVGRGRVIRSSSPADALLSLSPPTLEQESGPERIAWQRRRIGSNDVFFVGVQSDEPSEVQLKLRTSAGRPELWDPETGEMHPATVWQPLGDSTRVTVPFRPNGSAFIVFRGTPAETDPIIAAKLGDRSATALLQTKTDGSLEVRSRTGGEIELQRASGRTERIALPAPPPMLAIDGAWEVIFHHPGRDQRETFSQLVDWTAHEDENIRFFSGTAEYAKTFTLPPEARRDGIRAILDLGRVKNFAEVTVNGRAFPVLWRAPWQLDVTDAVRAGANELRIRITNTWVNRLVGDEHLPEDTTWRPVKAYASDHPVAAANAWPAWVTEGGVSPNGRQTFTAMKIVHRDSPLMESGLLGPVQILFESVRSLAVENAGSGARP